jgi:hypothetical protein
MSTETTTDGSTTTGDVSPAAGAPEAAPPPAPAAGVAGANGAGPGAAGVAALGEVGASTAAVPQTIWTRKDLALVALSAAGAVAWISWSFFWAPDNNEPTNIVWQWLACLAILGAFTIGVGHALTGYWKAILIDDRNKASLSRLQMVLWTGIVLSTYATAVAWNRDAGSLTPLRVPIPQELWMLMGIATASLAGSVLIKEDQKQRTGDKVDKNAEKLAELQAAKAAKGKNASELDRQRAEGDLAVNETPAAARWTDIFKGETTGNYPYLDLGKVQMFFFTVVLVAMYALAIGTAFAKIVGPDTFEFPVIDEAMLVLLGISHAGYLTLKAAKT